MGRRSKCQTKMKKTRATLSAPQTLSKDWMADIIQDWDRKSLTHLDWLSKNGHYISGEELALAIEVNPTEPLPDTLRSYLCRFLRGKVKRRPGPKASEHKFQVLIELLAAQEYRKELSRIRSERKLRGREELSDQELSPHKEALQIIKDRFGIRFRAVTLRRVANIISSHN